MIIMIPMALLFNLLGIIYSINKWKEYTVKARNSPYPEEKNALEGRAEKCIFNGVFCLAGLLALLLFLFARNE